MGMIELDNLIEKIRNGELYIKIVSVSRSVLSRRMKFYVANNSYIIDVTKHIKTLYKINNIKKYEEEFIKHNYEPLKVNGVGMDMCFAVVNDIGRLFNEYFSGYTYLD